MTSLFLDCEWADEIGRELVSLALISEDRTHIVFVLRYHRYQNSPLTSLATWFIR